MSNFSHKYQFNKFRLCTNEKILMQRKCGNGVSLYYYRARATVARRITDH